MSQIRSLSCYPVDVLFFNIIIIISAIIYFLYQTLFQSDFQFSPQVKLNWKDKDLW